MSSISAEDLMSLLAPDQGHNFVIDLLRREIWITGSIHGGVSRHVVRALRQLAELSDAPITVFVNSEGGDPYEAMIIADVIQALTAKGILVKTSVMGISYSAGVIISSAGTKGYRTGIPSSDFLIHQLSVNNVGGKIEDVEATTKNLKRLNETIGQYLSKMTGLPVAQIAEMMGKESYFCAKDAQKLGLIDRISIPGISEGKLT